MKNSLRYIKNWIKFQLKIMKYIEEIGRNGEDIARLEDVTIHIHKAMVLLAKEREAQQLAMKYSLSGKNAIIIAKKK